MKVVVQHEIRNTGSFQARGENLTGNPPDGIRPHQFYPAQDFTTAVCLWEAPSVDALREYIDGTLGDSAANAYFPVAEEAAIGLPA